MDALSPESPANLRPDLAVYSGNLPATVRALLRLLASSPDLYDRGGVAVRLIRPADRGAPVARQLTAHSVTMLTHDLCRPMGFTREGLCKEVTLPERAAHMVLADGDSCFRPLAGITTAPVLGDTGAIITTPGYDRRLALWCEPVPDLAVPVKPSRLQAEASLALLRSRFATFPFADAALVQRNGVDVVDQTKPPGMAESCYLAGLMTAACRPSLHTAPGLLISAPAITGAGSGKGLLVRAVCAVAFGMQPAAFTTGHDRVEADKRLVAELIEAGPAVFLDNVNGMALRSDTLASVLTERPARVRIMGQSAMVPLNSAAFIAVTGNGLSVSEDLARRFLSVDLDPRCEDPEGRPFAPGFLTEVQRDRAKLLSAALTIWRWGRQTRPDAGLPLGSFEQWAAWCRDPLVALGCMDPVQRIRDAKAHDPRRRQIAELFEAWSLAHGAAPIRAASLAETVTAILDPQGRGRQFIASKLREMIGTRGAGYVLTVETTTTKAGSTYALHLTDCPKPQTPPREWEAEL